MVVFETHAATGALLIWVIRAATGVMVIPRTELLPRAMSKFMVLLQLGSILMPVAHVSTGGIKTTHDEIWGPGRAGPALCWP